MPGYYQHVFGPKLRQRLEGWNDQGDVLDLREELALLRSICIDALNLYSHSLEEKPEGVMITGQVLTQAINQIKDMALAISRIESIRGNMITRDTMSVIARQLSQAAYEVFGEDDDRTDRFLDRVSEVFYDPTVTHQVEPERLVELMLNTVPAIPYKGNGNGNGNGNGHK